MSSTKNQSSKPDGRDIFAKWLIRQRQSVKKTSSTYWHEQGPRAYQAFPYHLTICPDDDELTVLLRETNAISLRYSTELSSSQGYVSYHAVFNGTSYNFNNLGKWARKNVRRGLKNCSIEQISFELLAEEGWQLQVDTLDRQGRKLPNTKTTWQNRCRAAVDLPGFEAWGAIVAGKLAASVITFQMEDCWYMLYQQCHRKYLRDHVNNALSFVVTKELISRSGINSIIHGLHSLDAPASVDEFKFRMGYSPKPVRQRVVFHPWIAPLMNRFSHIVLQKISRFRPGNSTLSKAEGMLRFYLEGKKPLDEQTWPEALLDQKEELLRKCS